MQYLTKPQLITINTLISKLRLQNQKDVMVYDFTEGRTGHSSNMYPKQATALIKHLKGLDPEEKSLQKQRNKILYFAHKLGWECTGGKVDMKRVDKWCEQSSYLKKKLDKYTLAEIPKLITQFEKVYKYYLSTL